MVEIEVEELAENEKQEQKTAASSGSSGSSSGSGNSSRAHTAGRSTPLYEHRHQQRGKEGLLPRPAGARATPPKPAVEAAVPAVIGWRPEGQSRRLVGHLVVVTTTDQWQCSVWYAGGNRRRYRTPPSRPVNTLNTFDNETENTQHRLFITCYELAIVSIQTLSLLSADQRRAADCPGDRQSRALLDVYRLSDYRGVLSVSVVGWGCAAAT
ncbi:hypothetical protein PISL3812_01063 [Talaromyces islandicus]|uniref:Uncharacterized protein n=1 Tax=Talaromyces islandicus TaxID=28573 RepID=A0A0U1LL29_TALIS|nr:hypothetical protein PISL3812_01063 [Talaromyces islandicus]